MTLAPEDERWLERTLELAERGRRTASPNPVVGCVLVRDGRVIGEGWHVRKYENHAEGNALAYASEDPAGATAYVSLEPCARRSNAVCCADLLIEARVARVVAAAIDPSERVNGKGLARLREAGIAVDVAEGWIERRARRQQAAFRVHDSQGRPFVLLKLAASLDGKIATVAGESRWISSPESRKLVHGWRADFDAVAIGSGTALADDPELTPRDADAPAPVRPRVVFDRRGRLPAESALVRTLDAGPVLRVAPAAAPDPPPGVERVDAADPVEALAALGRRGITSLLVEGGTGLAGGLLAAGLVDSVALFAAPLLIGGADAPGLLAAGVERLADAPRLRDLRSRAVGPDLLIEGELRDLP